VIPIDFALGLLAGIAGAAALYLLLWWQARRSTIGEMPPAGVHGLRSAPEPAPAIEPAGVPPEIAVANAPAPVMRGDPQDASPDPAGSAGAENPPAPPPAAAPASSVPRTGTVPRETLRLSQRIILHLYAQGELAPGSVAPAGMCQAGMIDALGVPQAGLAAVLSRLEAAGMFTTERGHVRGHDRRLKIYRLSSRGVQVAQELRRRSPRSSGR
jgi:DNA-binding MarR family transcriptional regulator